MVASFTEKLTPETSARYAKIFGIVTAIGGVATAYLVFRAMTPESREQWKGRLDSWKTMAREQAQTMAAQQMGQQ
jgi:hypothetical protein